MSAADALNKYYARQLKPKRQKRRNEKPEFEFKKQAVAWLRSNGFSIDVVESKAVFSQSSGRYLSGQAKAGFSDLVGVCPFGGVAAYIELKEPGRRSTLKPHQRQFLIEKISKFAFAACVDSIELLSDTFSAWRELFESGQVQEARRFLAVSLPKEKPVDDLTFD